MNSDAGIHSGTAYAFTAYFHAFTFTSENDAHRSQVVNLDNLDKFDQLALIFAPPSDTYNVPPFAN